MIDELPALRALRDELDRLARRDEAQAIPRRRWGVLMGGLAVVSASGAALAASGVLTGSPVRDPGHQKLTAHAGDGVVVASSAKLLALRVPDPAGGPPWALRTLRTTRALGCVQLGRVVDGQFGVLGQDGAFHDDGRLHPLGSSVSMERECQPLDAAGRAFLAIAYSGLPASASGADCAAPTRPHRPSRGQTLPVCPAADERLIAYGLLGPQAERVGYLDDAGRAATQRTSGPQGAYLVIRRPTPAHPAIGEYTESASPSTQLTSITYRDGRVCHLRSPRTLGGARACPLVGYTPFPRSKLTATQVATAVTARRSPHPVLVPTGPDNTPTTPAAWRVTLQFTSRVAATGRSSYSVTYALPGGSAQCASSISGPIEHDVSAWQTVTQDEYLAPGCPGAVRFVIRLNHPTRPDGFRPTNDDSTPVGAVTVKIPSAPPTKRKG